MNISLKPRTAEHVRIYFEKSGDPAILRTLPRKAQSVEEALSDYEKTLSEDASSFGLTIYADEKYVGDVWCYCIDMNETPNCMISYCIFDKEYWSCGIATRAAGMFIPIIREKYSLQSIGAFTYSDNIASIRVLEKNGFSTIEEFIEDGISSKYLQYNLT